jgi:hypothetical protein
MQFKHHFRVPRPADRSPLIQPMIQTPNHGAYPAGHSCQGYILSRVLQALVGNVVLGAELPTELDRLADRVGENRVVAGMHYAADITAGAQLGRDLAVRFLALANTGNAPTTALEWLWAAAAAEW